MKLSSLCLKFQKWFIFCLYCDTMQRQLVLIRTGFGYVSIIYTVDTNLLFLEVFSSEIK